MKAKRKAKATAKSAESTKVEPETEEAGKTLKKKVGKKKVGAKEEEQQAVVETAPAKKEEDDPESGKKPKGKRGRDASAPAAKAEDAPEPAAAEAAPKKRKKGKEAAAAEEPKPAEEAPSKNRKNKANRLAKAAEAFDEDGDQDGKADADEEESVKPGVVYLARVPKGFEENQMRTFFKQFGVVTRIRLARSKKTRGFKGYGWVEFQREDVAKIVAESMQGYLLAGKTMKCNLVPEDKLHPDTFKGARRHFVDLRPVHHKKHMSNANDRPTVEVKGVAVPQITAKQVQRSKASEKRWKQALEKLGVEYDFNPEVTVDDGDPDIIA
mmetsp:Transcript_22656/g.52882  ORF Transcript_22656/g.52882 Transcript_22656/m.52882 type:complete len:325 (-) Transcript_22656:104-1078(-)